MVIQKINTAFRLIAATCLAIAMVSVTSADDRAAEVVTTHVAPSSEVLPGQFVAMQSCGCNQCLQCVDRDGDGLIGGFGINQGIGPCDHSEQCWQCPYNSPFNSYGPGAYAGPARTMRLPEYRLRTGDQVELTFTINTLESRGEYVLAVGDELMIESIGDPTLNRGTLEKGKGLKIQPDGKITMPLIGQVEATRKTIGELRASLNRLYKERDLVPNAQIDVTPVYTGAAAERIREATSGFAGFSSQQVQQRITPSGEIRLPGIGSVQAQGLTLDELKVEINLRYDGLVGEGLVVEPSLKAEAPHYFFVLGEAAQPGRFAMDTPTTVLGAIAMAGGHVPGANLRQVVIFRRGENFELLSTLLDLRGAILGRKAHPADEIWVRDGDVIILPSMPIRLFDNFVRQVFTEGIYGVVPFQGFSVDYIK